MDAEKPQQDLGKYQLCVIWLMHHKGRAYKLQDEAPPKAPRSGAGAEGKASSGQVRTEVEFATCL